MLWESWKWNYRYKLYKSEKSLGCSKEQSLQFLSQDKETNTSRPEIQLILVSEHATVFLKSCSQNTHSCKGTKN